MLNILRFIGHACRLPLREVTADVEQSDPLVLMDVRPSASTPANSSCDAMVGHLGDSSEHNKSPRKRKESPT